MTDIERVSKAIPILLSWYRENRRPLPWRASSTPYAVWISEVMLQQTRIEAVIPKYLAFMERLPTVEALAEADEEELMKLWEGLGYYSRARNLQKAARAAVEKYGGALPKSAAELRALPGIGDYTAGAVSSIAYGQPEPAVDGNVLRVALRLTCCREDALDPRTRSRVTQLLRGLYPTGEDAATLTEGLMELGETVCLPRQAVRCEACPLSALCLARERGEAAGLPLRSPKKPRRVEERTALLLSCGDKYAVQKRPDAGLLSGLWEFPNFDGFLEPDEVIKLLTARGLEPMAVEPCGQAKHLFTHVEWRLLGYRVPCAREAAPYAWRTPQELRKSHALPSAFRFLMERI